MQGKGKSCERYSIHLSRTFFLSHYHNKADNCEYIRYIGWYYVCERTSTIIHSYAQLHTSNVKRLTSESIHVIIQCSLLMINCWYTNRNPIIFFGNFTREDSVSDESHRYNHSRFVTIWDWYVIWRMSLFVLDDFRENSVGKLITGWL